MVSHCVSSEDMFIDFRERKEEREGDQRERETLISCLLDAPWLGLEPATFWRMGQCSNPLSRPARAHCDFDCISLITNDVKLFGYWSTCISSLENCLLSVLLIFKLGLFVCLLWAVPNYILDINLLLDIFLKYIYWLCYYSCPIPPPHSTPSCPPPPSLIRYFNCKYFLPFCDLSFHSFDSILWWDLGLLQVT